MKKLIIYTLMFSLTINLSAQEIPLEVAPDSPYRNIRESRSALISKLNEDEITRLYKGTKSLIELRSIMSDTSVNRCASALVERIENKLNLNGDKDIETAVLGLRLDDSIDDIAATILIKAAKLSKPLPHPIANDDLSPEEEKKALEVFSGQVKEIKNKTLCIEDTYRSLVSSLAKESNKFKKSLKHINRMALDRSLISEAEFKKLEKMRSGKVHEWPLTLANYAQNLDSLAKRFPDRIKEASPLITEDTVGKYRNKKSLRHSLHEKFNSTQIILLANMVRDLKKRLEAKDITINISYIEQQTEIISLSPMEKFRFILKLLRKELATINNSSLLNGYQATYIDIIAASYEVGYISAAEIEALASLEDIWNPKKTTKEKVMVWAKRFGGVASVLLPPPFGFVSVMAIMMIDQYIQEAPIDRDPDYNIF